MVPGDGERVPARRFPHHVLRHVGDEAERRLQWEERLVLRLHLFEDVGLHGAAQRLPVEAAPARRDEKHRHERGCGPVDGHRDGRAREVEAVVEAQHVVKRIDGDTALPDLGERSGFIGVEAVEREGVKCGGEPGCPVSRGEEMEAGVRRLRHAESGEHADGVLVAAAVAVCTLSERESAGEVLRVEVAHDLAWAGVAVRQAEHGRPETGGGLTGDGHAPVGRIAVRDAVLDDSAGEVAVEAVGLPDAIVLGLVVA